MMRMSFSAIVFPKISFPGTSTVWMQSYEDQCSLIWAPRDEDNLVPMP